MRRPSRRRRSRGARPTPMPIPSSALPAPDMIVRTSAKSRLISPGSVTRSEMPWTPWRRTSSATRNASTIEVLRSSTVSRRLLGTTISVSTSSASAVIPASACARRREPSNWNGRVTIPTVSAPSSRAIWATTGAAPVPVPPPAPAAMKTMSEPRSSALMRSYSSRAAWRPRSGFEPEPSPRVTRVADVQGLVGRRLLQRLQVGVDRDELDALDLGLDHAVDGVDAGAADADHGQDRARGTHRVIRLRPGVHVGLRRQRGLLGRSQHVLGNVGREGVAQPLLGRRDPALGLLRRRGRRRRACACGAAGAAGCDALGVLRRGGAAAGAAAGCSPGA